MSVKYGKFEMPEKIKIEEGSATKTYGKYIVSPFERGWGHTLGNFLRRVLLSCLEAPAIISIRIEGVPHEYMAIEGVTEDMADIILNLKGALLRKLPSDEEAHSRQAKVITSIIEVTQNDLDKNKGQVEIKLKDLMGSGHFEIVNPDMQVMTVTKPLKKRLDLKIGMGRGYVPSERHQVREKIADEIIIDSAYSPVTLVNYYVENTRVGQDTDYDSLILEITTDGRITPHEALTFGSQIGVKHFDVFEKIKKDTLTFDEGKEGGDSDYDEIMKTLCLKVNEIELSVRSWNCLKEAKIETIAELVIIPEKQMLGFRNFGKKSLNEIKAKLHELGLSLGMDLSRYGITADNVREEIEKYLAEKEAETEQA